ncbi:hypothetical protein HDE_14494 [Halotydeus destructor]|nr:hypothetical protein HDE_14494 [Halotydeus destructor]
MSDSDDDLLNSVISSSKSKNVTTSKRHQKQLAKDEERKRNEKIALSRELNPTLRTKTDNDVSSSPRDTSKDGGPAGDFGASWLQKAYDRVMQQAKETGKSANEVAC